MLVNKRIIVGVSGSIAAYKSALLVRLLIKAGAEVQVVMTDAAQNFITPLTLATLSKRPAVWEFVKNQAGEWNNHVELGLWADAIVVAPATAHTLSKCANGTCDDLLTATYLSARCPVFFAPAMDLDMYCHGSTLENLDKLQRFGNQIIKPNFGELASGLVGDGRMAEPDEIVAQLDLYFAPTPALIGTKVLITAGPTQESIDPVRYVSNHSSGKMGYAIAHAFAAAGAHVTLVSGPTALPKPAQNVAFIGVTTAQEMFEATAAHFENAHVVIFAAAVADYTPRVVATQKIKKKEDSFSVEFTKTIDIAATLGATKKAGQLLVGFALETDNELVNAKDKLLRKHFDLIVLNSMQDKGAGFAHDTNKITVIDSAGNTKTFALKTKAEVAKDILELVVQKIM